MEEVITAIALATATPVAPAADAPTDHNIVTETVVYKEGETRLVGYLAYDAAITEPRPGVLVVHQWRGLTDYERERARMLAELGYVAFAVDIYGDGINPAAPTETSQWVAKFRGDDRSLFRARLTAGMEQLTTNERVDADRIAAIGYCFGGTGALELARSGADVRGVVSFHGGLGTPDPGDASNITGSVLVLHGAVDPHVPAEEVAAFHKEMEDAKVDYQFVSYGGAVHSFTEKHANSATARYDEKADRRSWQAMQDFFDEIFLPAP